MEDRIILPVLLPVLHGLAGIFGYAGIKMVIYWQVQGTAKANVELGRMEKRSGYFHLRGFGHTVSVRLFAGHTLAAAFNAPVRGKNREAGLDEYYRHYRI